jgi:putative ABC transport system permease protein
VRERTPEFAVLETLGFRNAQVMLLVFVEAVIPCATAALLGTAAAMWLAKTSQHFLAPSLSTLLTERPPPWLYVLGVAIGFAMILAVATTAVPLSRLRRMSVTDALAGR